MDDPRLTPARPEVAAAYLEGKVKAARFVAGETFEVAEPIAPLREQPAMNALLSTVPCAVAMTWLNTASGRVSLTVTWCGPVTWMEATLR